MIRFTLSIIVAAVAAVAAVAVSADGQPAEPRPSSGPATRPATTPAARWPDETTTGVRPGVELRPSGWVKVKEAGSVIEGLEVRGKIVIEAAGVIVRNCRIIPPAGDVGIKITSSGRGALIEDCEITGPDCTNGVSGSNYTARRLHIHHMGADAFRVVRGVTIEGCYVHDLGLLPKSHGDGVQMYPTHGSGMRIIGNHFDARGANAALFEVNNGWHIEGNYFNGGNYTIQCEGTPENVFRDNYFGPDFKYGAVRVGSGDARQLTWVNNRYAKTDMPVHLNIRRTGAPTK